MGDMPDLRGLDQFKLGDELKPPTEEDQEWFVPVEPYDETRKILAFDQSLANTGYVLLLGAKVSWTGNLKNSEKLHGPGPQLDRAVELYGEVGQVIFDNQPDLIVIETPPSGSRLMRPESSLMAATVIRIAAAKQLIGVSMIGAQTAKKRLTGNGNAKKSEVAAAIKRLDPGVTMKKPMNEAIYDAIAIGWVAAERK